MNMPNPPRMFWWLLCLLIMVIILVLLGVSISIQTSTR